MVALIFCMVLEPVLPVHLYQEVLSMIWTGGMFFVVTEDQKMGKINLYNLKASYETYLLLLMER